MPRGGARPRKPGAKYGRPSKGDRQLFGIRLPVAAADTIRRIAARSEKTPSQTIARLVTQALDLAPECPGIG